MINYFKELLATLKSIDTSLKVIAMTTTTASDGYTRCINTIQKFSKY
jgi:hypothetical protein